MNPRSIYPLALLCALSVVGAPAEKDPPPTAEAVSEIKIKEAPSASAPLKSEKDAAGQDTLSVDFPDEDVRTILRHVADLFDLNLVIPETLQGKTSIKLRDVTWRQIFQVVLGPVGYTYLEDGNIIKIVSNASLQQEPVSTEVFILNYARAAEIQATIASLVEPGAGGKLMVDTRSNALVITERPSRLLRIGPIIESLDRATDQVMIESKFIEVTDRDIRNLGVNWASLQSYKVGVGSGSTDGVFGKYSRTQNQTNNNSNNAGANGASSSSNSGSSSSSQSSSSASSSSVTSTNGSLASAGSTTSDSSLSGSSSSESSNSSSLGSTYDQLANLAGSTATDRTLTAVFSAADFNLVLSALNTLSTTKIVSNPTVVTLNNTEATINVGEEYPIPKYTYNQERGTFEVSGFDYRSIGIILKVTPQVNSRGFIKLNLEPEVSQRNGETSFGGASGAAIPIIASRKAKTQVSLKDGFTMGIGGLLRKQTTDGSTKVPLLGDIPLLGRLFKSKSKDADTTNLLIFITAKVLSSEGGTVQQVFDPRQVREVGLRENDLPGYREDKSPLLPAETPAQEKTKTGSGKDQVKD